MVQADTDTIVAQSSPPGASAGAIVRLSGSRAFEIAGRFLNPAVPLPNRPRSVGADLQLPAWPASVPVLVYCMPGPKTYTTETVVELHLPGSLPLIAELISACCAAGARPARPGEFTERAFLNGRLDLAQAEGVAALIHARDRREQELATRLLTGDFSRRINALRASLLELAALLELDLDFSDQDVDVVSPEQVADRLSGLLAELNTLIDAQASQRSVHAGIRVALLGPPNAGKSTLFNALLGRKRAVVTDVAGTTRDALEEDLEFQGAPVRLMDTAGVFEANDDLTKESVRRTLDLLHTIDGCVVLATAEQWRAGAATTFDALLPAGLPRMFCLSMADRESAQPDDGREWTPIAATTGLGLDGIQAAFQTWGRAREQESSEYLISTRNLELLRRCREDCDRALDGARGNAGFELVAADCRNAMGPLGDIVGAITSDEILGSIFGSFCIGK